MMNVLTQLQRCLYLFLVVSVLSVTATPTSSAFDSPALEQQENGLVYAEKQELSEEEVAIFSESENVDQVAAGHRPVPVRGGFHAGDIFFWSGIFLISLSLAFYAY